MSEMISKEYLPHPVKRCRNIKDKGTDEWTIREWLQKANEELDELKAEILFLQELDSVPSREEHTRFTGIAEEACDCITVLTSMLEAFGINEHDRLETQREVNRKNHERGYW